MPPSELDVPEGWPWSIASQVDKDDFLTDQVYAATTRPELHLITCGGTFNRASGNYSGNIVSSLP